MSEPLTSRVLLIGWDAADWEIAEPLIASGHMPNLQRMVQHGAAGPLHSLQPMLSPLLWTSIATGKRPPKHGIYGFTEPRPDGRGIRPASSDSRSTKALWNILSDGGLRTHAVGWYASHPAEPINGVCISNCYAVAPPSGQPWPVPPGTIYPERLSEELSQLRLRPEEVGLAQLQAFIPDAARIDPRHDDRLLKCAVMLAETATTHAAATWILERQPWDFLAVLYDGIDHFSHLFIDYHPPQQRHVSDEDFARYRHVLSACYQFFDLMLGRLLQLAGQDATVIIVSDHGFLSGDRRLQTTDRSLEGLSKWHRPEGLVAMCGRGIRSGARLREATLLDVAPSVLQLLGFPVGDDMDGRPWVEVMDDARQPQFIPSWDAVGEVAEAMPAPNPALQTPIDSLQMLRHLIALGYLAPPSEDAQADIDACVTTNQFNLARALLDAGNYVEGVTMLESLVQRHPDNRDFAAALAAARDARPPHG